MTPRVGLTKVNGEDGFGVFGGNAEDCDHPHPEDGARSTNGNGTGDASDIARSNRGGQRRHQGLERCDLTVAGGLAGTQHHRDAVAQALQWHEAKANHQPDSRQGNQRNSRPAPDQAINGAIDRLD